jgi:3-dehydroquinate dehydratase type I
VILSSHDFSKTPPPEELNRILEAEKRLGGDICKLVTTARSQHDNLTILTFLEAEANDTKLVSFAMGREGVTSRILSPIFGAQFTFAALSEESRTADGQLTLDELRSAWQILGIH